ncbi:transglutaminase-like domain-containing protein [Hathewaya limosa]|uniref:Transglutaminase-like domain-containing protein n=1 Tax=Hathewaya limosa TaxID=1536 RepID=A0ABU0JYK7_HATLI|nr:transglutaminase-like domain-containing protein [Hathewaya limosa]MDQ0480987.1 hypothetical protein [Hathewaya limosa]
MNLDKKSFYLFNFCVCVFTTIITSNCLFHVAKTGLRIKNIDYKFLFFLCMISIFIYIIFFKCINNKFIRLYVFIGILIFGGFIYFLNHKFIHQFINSNILINYDILEESIYKTEVTYFKNYKPILTIFLPIVYLFTLWITENFWKNVMVFVTTFLLIVLWFINKQLCLAYMKPILFFNMFILMVNSYIGNLKILIKKDVEIKIKPILFMSIFLIMSIVLNKGLGYISTETTGRISENKYRGFINNIIYGKAENIDNEINQFNLNEVGYSNSDKKLGGPISINKKQLMKIKCDKPYFLKGRVKDIYDGYRWNKRPMKYMDFGNEIDLGIYNLGDMRKVEVTNKKMEIKLNEDFLSRSFFAPFLSSKLYTTQSGNISYDKEQNIMFSDSINEKYSVIFSQLKHVNGITLREEILDTNEEFREYMNYPIEKISNNSGNWPENFYYGDYEYLIRDNYEKYIQLPQNISKRVYDLTYEITKGCKDSMSKVHKIKEYLEKNYKYSLDVSNIPEDQEFLEYFLFDQKKGYCTYFATAMAIMCRIEGIPARYVEGFKMSDNKDKEGYYYVGTQDAHAWCEVLVIPECNVWAIAEPKVSLEGHTNNIRRSPVPREQVQQIQNKDIKNEKKPNNKEVDKNKPKNNVKNRINKKERAKNDKSIKIDIKHLNMIKKVTLGLISLLAIMLMLIFILRLRFNVKRDKILKSDSVIYLYKYYIYCLGLLNIKKKDSQGDLEFAKCIDDIYISLYLKEIVNDMYLEYYGKENSSLNKEFYYNQIDEYIKSNLSKLKYYIFR